MESFQGHDVEASAHYMCLSRKRRDYIAFHITLKRKKKHGAGYSLHYDTWKIELVALKYELRE